MSRNMALEMLGIVAAVIGVVAGVGCQIERKIREEVDVVREELNKTISHEAEMFRRDIDRHEREITALRETRHTSADASGIMGGTSSKGRLEDVLVAGALGGGLPEVVEVLNLRGK